VRVSERSLRTDALPEAARGTETDVARVYPSREFLNDNLLGVTRTVTYVLSGWHRP
jgi:hypothetical protein